MTTDTQTPDTPAPRFTSPAQLEYERMLAAKAVPQVQPSEVRVVDIDMPIGSMVAFMLKWAIASIPALSHLELCGSVPVRSAGRYVQVTSGA
jgi:hypothetical protein